MSDLAHARFDDGQVYVNSKGKYQVVAEFFATMNGIGPKIVTETDTDRMAIFSFNHSVCFSCDYSSERSADQISKEKPFPFMIMEMGIIFESQEFINSRDRYVLSSSATHIL